MTITKKAEGSLLTIALAGRLDSATAPQLEAELGNDLTNVKDLIFDMADLEYLSSAGLRLLLSASKIMAKQGSMKLIHVNQSIKDVFEITGFSDILTTSYEFIDENPELFELLSFALPLIYFLVHHFSQKNKN